MLRSPGFLIGEIVVFILLVVLCTPMLIGKSPAPPDREPYRATLNSYSIEIYDPQNPRFEQQVMLAKGDKVNQNDFNLFVKELAKYNMTVKQAGSSEDLRKQLVEERADQGKFFETGEGHYRKETKIGIFIKELDFSKGKHEYEMFLENRKIEGGMRHGSFGPDWCQSIIDLVFYEGVKKHKGVNDTEEVKVGAYEMQITNPSSEGSQFVFLEMKNLIVITIIIFTVRGIMHDNEHMKDFMNVMGVTDTVFYSSHILFLFIKQLIFVTPIALLTSFAFERDVQVTLGMVFFANFIEFFAIIAFALLMSSLFKSAAVTCLATVVIFLGLFVWASIADVCLPSEGACVATFLNPLLAKANFIKIADSITSTHKSYSFSNLFEWKSFHYPGIVPLAFILLDAILMLAAFVLIIKWKSISCKRISNHSKTDEEQPLFSNAEETSEIPNAKVDIEIKNVTKVYKTGQRAVHGLHLEAIKGQVTVLLGHNGAGKTTTFSMICGTEKPTEGTLNICGHPAGSSEAKKHIGYCSQKNTLLDSLTVYDHLRLAYNLKCAKSDFREEMEELLELVDLVEYQDKKTKTLSGGQKRKLCLCMALIGESSVVLLDEPTAGMDVESRQEIETFLDSQKGNRTILLTTHYMDEAECLGDRVFIMSGGRVVCSGTSDFLKKRFASGYTLTILAKNKQENMQPQAKNLEKYLRNHVKDAKLTEIRGIQMDFELSPDSKDRFAALLEDLEKNKETLGIANFGLSMGNLEQVFLKVGHATNDVKDKDKKEERVRGLLKQVYEDDSVQGCGLLMAQFIALFKKKLRYSMIKWPMTIFVQILAPILVLCLSMFLTKVDVLGDPTYDISLKNFGAGQFLTQDLFINGQSQFKPHFDKFIKEELKTNEEMELNVIEGRKVEDLDDYAITQVDDPQPAMAVTYGMECGSSGCKNVDGATATVRRKINGRVEENKKVEFVLLRFNSRHLYSHPTALNLFGNARLRKIAPGSQPAQIGVNFLPDGRITMNVRFFEGESRPSTLLPFGISLLMTLLMTLVFASLTEPLAEDTTSGFMYQQILAGVPVWLYWTVEYLYGFLLYSIQCSIYLTTLCLMCSYSVENAMRAVLMVLIFFYSVMPLVCWLSTKCKSVSTATVSISLFLTLGILAGMIFAGVIMTVMGQFASKHKWTREQKEEMDTNIFLSASFFFPSLSFLFGLFEINGIQAAQNAKPINVKVLVKTNPDMFVMVAAIPALIHTLFFVIGTINFIRRCCSCKGSMSQVPEALHQENQVLTEETVLEVKDLSKVFRKKCALAHVSFQVQKQECFGLLGVSGAGKTTAFNIITGQMVPSEGSVTLDGVDIKTNIIVGLCPQFDTLQPTFKGKHSLEILAKVNGYRDVDGVVEKLIEMVDMEEHAGKRFNTCSGGQKRRLSVAAALLPRKSPFVILDEATAGIDPVARRDVWSVLSVVREHSAILMSSHSMEECDALCSRISILKDGQIAATGSSQELKSRLGNFYVLSLSLSGEQDKDKAQRTVSQHFPGSSLQKGSFSRNMKWKLPRRQEDLWSNVFDRCQTIASKMGANDFCVTQPSLQDIFLIIAGRRRILQ